MFVVLLILFYDVLFCFISVHLFQKRHSSQDLDKTTSLDRKYNCTQVVSRDSGVLSIDENYQICAQASIIISLD